MNIALTLLKRFWPDLVLVAIFAVLSGFAYHHGHNVGTAEAQAKHAQEIQRRDQQAADALAAALDKAGKDAADALEAERANTKAQADTETHFKTIIQTVTKYVHENPAINSCGLDDDALRLWNSAHDAAAYPGASPTPARP